MALSYNITTEPRDPDALVWADGCFDLIHWGHANLLRQARLQGCQLVAGVHSDDQIQASKGALPAVHEALRYKIVGAIRWVDKVVKGAPYTTQIAVLKEHGCSFCVHGDDVCLSNGVDVYEAMAMVRWKRSLIHKRAIKSARD